MDNLLSQGFELALFGMGTVFVFLTLLVVATKVMSALVLRYEPVASISSAEAVAQDSSVADPGRLIAIISAAIAQHRASNK